MGYLAISEYKHLLYCYFHEHFRIFSNVFVDFYRYLLKVLSDQENFLRMTFK